MLKTNFLYKAKHQNSWIHGYPFIKDGKVFLKEDETGTEYEIDENTLCKKITSKYYEHDLFEYQGYQWVLKYCKELFAYQLTREDTDIHFTHYLPLALLDDAKFLKNEND